MAQRSMQMGMHTEKLSGKTQQRFFSPTEEENFLYPDGHDVDFNKRAEFDAGPLSAKEINLKLRELMSQGNGTIVMHNPGAKHGVDTTDTFDLGVDSLKAHRAYIDGLGWPDFDEEEMLEGFSRPNGARMGVTYAAPNAAKALRLHSGYAQDTKKGKAITPRGIQYVEEALKRAGGAA